MTRDLLSTITTDSTVVKVQTCLDEHNGGDISIVSKETDETWTDATGICLSGQRLSDIGISELLGFAESCLGVKIKAQIEREHLGW